MSRTDCAAAVPSTGPSRGRAQGPWVRAAYPFVEIDMSYRHVKVMETPFSLFSFAFVFRWSSHCAPLHFVDIKQLLMNTPRGRTMQVCVIYPVYLFSPKFTNVCKKTIKLATRLGQHRISHRSHLEEHLTLVTALDRSSPSTLRPQRKRTTRWSSSGRKMLMGFSFS
jgi:hypothetical protein